MTHPKREREMDNSTPERGDGMKKKSREQMRLRKILERNEGHDMRVHNGKAASQTGLLKGCFRCEVLMQIKT